MTNKSKGESSERLQKKGAGNLPRYLNMIQSACQSRRVKKEEHLEYAECFLLQNILNTREEKHPCNRLDKKNESS